MAGLNDQITQALGASGSGDPTHAAALTNIATNGNLLNQNISKLIQAFSAAFPVSGTLPVVNGGTGSSTLTLNGVLYGNGASAIGATAQGGANTVLIANAGVPSFSAAITVGTSVTSPLLVASTSATAPLLLGGTGTGSTLTLQSTSGVGSGDAIIVKGGNNGATELVRWNTTNGTRLAAGTTSLAPLTFQSGTNLTTAAAGAGEFDGTCFYASAAASSRQVVVTEQLTSLTADYTLTDSATAQKAFNASSNGSVTLAASTAYEVEMLLIGTNTGTTSHTWGILFAGAATITAAGTMLKVQAYTATSNALTAESGIYIVGAGISSVTAVTAASVSATENVSIYVRGRININGAGTLIPQVKFSAQPNGTEKILAGSFIRLWPIGAGSVTNVGNWS